MCVSVRVCAGCCSLNFHTHTHSLRLEPGHQQQCCNICVCVCLCLGVRLSVSAHGVRACIRAYVCACVRASTRQIDPPDDLCSVLCHL